MSSPIIVDSGGPSLVVRLLWFIFVGWWLGGIVTVFAWLLVCMLIGIPAGLWLINRLPSVITLRPQQAEWQLHGNLLVRGKPQRPFWVRTVYFLIIGWWLSLGWAVVAYLATVSIVLLPVGFVMYGRIGAVTTLYRS